MYTSNGGGTCTLSFKVFDYSWEKFNTSKPILQDKIFWTQGFNFYCWK